MRKEEDLRVRRTRKLLIESLMSLMQERSFEKISINDICERAMVHRATFYNHFDDKQSLFNFALDEIEEEMFLSTIEKGEYNSSKEMYLSLLKNVFDYIDKNRDKFKLIIENNSGKLISIISDTMKRSVRYFISKNEQQHEYVVPLNIIIDFFMGGIAFLCLDWIKLGTYSKEELLKFFEIFLEENNFLKNKN